MFGQGNTMQHFDAQFFSCVTPAPPHHSVQETISRNRFREIMLSSDTPVPGKVCGLPLPKISALCKKSFQLTERLQGLSSTSVRLESLGFVVWCMSVPQKGVGGFQTLCGDSTGASISYRFFCISLLRRSSGWKDDDRTGCCRELLDSPWSSVFCFFSGHWFCSW